jgi:hypothetical protein
MVVTYKGSRDGSSCSVSIEGRPLDPRLDLRSHTPGGFDWGNDGDGAAQLALAILADHAGDEVALRLYQEFKQAVIARLPPNRWTLSHDDIDHALAVIETTGIGGKNKR